MDTNKQVTPAAKSAAKTRGIAKPAPAQPVSQPLKGLPSEPKPVAAAAKPAVAKATPLTPAVAKPVKPAAVKASAPVVAQPVNPTAAPAPKPAKPAPAPVAKASSPAAPAPKPRAAKAPVAPTRPLSPTAAVPAEPKPKEITMEATSTVENAAHDTAAKTQALFGEAQARTQATMEKSAKLFEEAVAFSKENLEAVVESSKIAAKGAETLGQGAADYAKRSFETATQTLKTLSSVKSPTEFMKLQSDFARSAFDSLVAETSRSTETVMKLAGEIAQPISNRFAVAAEKMKTVA
ncbi:phasin family protein [Sphingomonadaceae bacterium jetA1]|uniref:phasin family protein n=1 Tax=Facivitalis istanbulensis TaxID=3075838 RepID=UPI00346A6E42